MIKKALLIGLLAILTAGLFWGVGLFWFGYHINNYPLDLSTKTDAAIVLTGGRNRVAEGIKILNHNLADRLFISGVSKNVTISQIERQLHMQAVDESRVELGYYAKNTLENAEEVKEWVEKNHIRSLRLVTSNYHLLRSMLELSEYQIPAQIIIHPVYSEKVAAKWWQSKGTCRLIISEYNKLLYAGLRHYLSFKKEK